MVGGLAAGLPQAGAGPVRLRDRRRGHAAGRRAAPTTPSAPGGPHRGRAQAARHRRPHHERLPACFGSFVTTAAHPARRVPARRPGQRPRTRVPGPPSTSGRRSAPSTTPPSRSCGSPARRRWPGCSTWSPLPAALRHGAAVGAGGPAARLGVLRHRLRRHVYFDADVNAQGGAVRDRRAGPDHLRLRRRDAVGAPHQQPRRGRGSARSAVFAYTTAANIVERPDGLKIGGRFILAILVVSLASTGSPRLRAAGQTISSTRRPAVPRRPARSGGCASWRTSRMPSRRRGLPREGRGDPAQQRPAAVGAAPLLEVTVSDSSDFETDLHVRGEERFGFRILTVRSSVIANTIAELLLRIRDDRASRRRSTSPGPRAIRCSTCCASCCRRGRGRDRDTGGAARGRNRRQPPAQGPRGLTTPVRTP